MDLTRALLRVGYGRPHVLLVEARGGAVARIRAEGWLTEQGWDRAVSPADADLLLVAGRPGPELRERVERVWEQLPGPRARAAVIGEDEPARALLAARERLWDLDRQRADARGRGLDQPAEQGDVAMADTGDDRDGLALDALHVALGPVLPHWPAGVVAELTLQGDVVREARLHRLDADPDGGADTGSDAGVDVHCGVAAELPAGVAALDRAVAVLRLAGSRWALPAQALRSAALAGALEDASLTRLRQRVAGDRALRWSLRRLPAVGADDLWSQLLDGLTAPTGSEPPAANPVCALDDVAAALVGLDLGAVRLLVAAARLAEPAVRPVARA